VILLACPLSRFLYHQHAAHSALTGGAPSDFGLYTWNNLDGLALGALIAILVRTDAWNRKKMMLLSLGLVGIAVLITACGLPLGILTRRSAIGEALQAVPWNLSFAGLLCVFLLLGSGPWRRATTPSLLIFLGKISYGLYLYHLMIFVGYGRVFGPLIRDLHLSPWEQLWTRMILAGSAAIFIAYISRQTFEEAFLRLKDRFSKTRTSAERDEKAVPAIL
jgi:peptidoglycan/LPS O-acetylase OafA/YrhL